MTDGTNAIEFKLGWAYQTGDASFHGQVTIKCNTKVSDRVRHGIRGSSSESGEEEERGLDSLPEDTIVASVLSSLNLSLFTVIQVLMSSVHFCKERRFLFCLTLIQYNEYNTIIEHVSTSVPSVDNIHIQIYMYMLCIHNTQKDTSIQTSIQTKSWTKYFIDRYLPCTKSD